MNLRPLCAKAARLLLLWALSPNLKAALPKVYRHLDSELPFWINQHVAGGGVQTTISRALSEALHRSPEPYEISLIRLLYDPVAAAQGAYEAWERKRHR